MGPMDLTGIIMSQKEARDLLLQPYKEQAQRLKSSGH
jgi:hypothetical protein